jgi:hypothetical protein
VVQSNRARTYLRGSAILLVFAASFVDQTQHRLSEKRRGARGSAFRDLPFDHALKLVG